MSRVGNVSNLESGSTYDILLFDFDEGYPVGAVKMGFGKTPKRISGVQKVAQTVVKCLMSRVGSDVVHSGRGTNFAEFANGNSVVDDIQEAKREVSRAVDAAEKQAKGILNIPSAGLASQLQSVTVTGLQRERDSTSLKLKIVTRAGESAPIALPFTSLGIEVNA